MQSDHSPVFRKAIVPWYDSDLACIMMAALMLFVVLFGVDGIKVARQTDAYHSYVWAPISLVIMSFSVFASTIIRLLNRHPGSSSI